jgi:hypothetical protein
MDGSFTTSSILQLTFTSDPAVAVIVSPDRAELTPDTDFFYTIVAPSSAGSSDPTIFSYVGTLPPGLVFDSVNGTISGTYTPLLQDSAGGGPLKPELAGGALLGSIQLFGTNSHGTGTILLEFLPARSRVVNISTRLLVGTGDNVLIGGFIITGNAPKVVLIRAIGPSSGIPGALQDPILELHSGSNVVTNDNWITDPTQEQLINYTTIQPGDDRESAILAGLDPGEHTAIVRGKNDTMGIALVEVYDLGTGSLDISVANSKLANISTRGNVLVGDNVMIGGFIDLGVPTRVIVRAIGPSLPVPGTLGDPTLQLRDGNGGLIDANDNWRSDHEAEIIATTIPPSNDLESAIVATLGPGLYTAIVAGTNDTTGVAQVEVYALP